MFSCCVEDLNKCKVRYRKETMGKNLHVIIGLPMRVTPNQEMRSKFFLYQKRQNGGWNSQKAIFAGRRWVIPRRTDLEVDLEQTKNYFKELLALYLRQMII